MKLRVVFLLFLNILNSTHSNAVDYEEYILFHHSNMCGNYFEYFEQKYDIPKHLLRSISVVESGRWYNKAQLYLTWPWAVNQAGKAYYFATKKDAIEGVKAMLTQGLTNIDVGCMQINLHHHPSAFNNLNQAFDPKDNIAYAAFFLNSHYRQSGDWKKAVAAYHSQTSAGIQYATKVLNIHTRYKGEKLALDYCSSPKGEVMACKTATKKTSNSEIYNISYTEALPKDSINTKLSIKQSTQKTRKDAKRLKSAMILYSSNSE